MSIHLIISEAEQFAIVNALAFYNDVHACEMEMEDDDCWEQWRIAFREDNHGTEPDGLVDKLATKIASLN
jgi:hypothetical protein